ncbi:MAG: hypothetical protein R3228_11695 [Halioglobus sp.]|nr:hypothetical protein [Halioglobus sp.]
MKYALPLLLAIALPAHAAPIKWTSVDDCFDPGAVICGSFYFDNDTGNYSHVNLAHTEDYGRYNSFTGGSGDRHNLYIVKPFPNEPHTSELRLTGYNLANVVQQTFNWQFDFGPVETMFGSGELIPSFEPPPPPPLPVPASLPLVATGLLVLRWLRRRP